MTKLLGFRPQSHRQVFTIALPMVVSNIAAPMLGLVDTAIIGHLPQSIYLSGVALGAMIVSFIYLLAVFLRMTTTGVVAQAQGARDDSQLQAFIQHGAWFALGLGLLLWLAKPLLLELAWWLTQPEAALKAQAALYIEIRLWAAPAALFNLVVLGVLLGLKRSRQAMLLVIFTNAVNVAGDLIFIIGLDLTVAGAAWASVLAEVATALLGAWLLMRHANWRWQWQLQLPLLQRLMGMNRDVFIRSLVLQLCLATMTGYATRFGHEVVAANAVLMQFLLLISLGLDGLAYAVEALVGHAKGARQERRIRYWFGLTLIWSGLFALAYSLIFAVFGAQIIAALTDITSIRQTAEHYLGWLIILPLLAHWSYAYDGLFIGLSWTKAMRNTMLAAALLGFVPIWLGVILSDLSNENANHGLWLALSVFLLSRGVAQAIFTARQPRFAKP